MSDFVYPPNLTERIKASWNAQLRNEKDTGPSLPADDVLLSILDIAYHASLLSEEQRRVGFRLIVCSKADLNPAEHHKYHRQIGVNVAEFSKPRAFSVAEVLRLAPATDFTSS